MQEWRTQAPIQPAPNRPRPSLRRPSSRRPRLGTHCLFEEIALATGVELTNETFGATAITFDEFVIPGQPFASLGPDKFDTNDSFALVAFNPDVGADGGLDQLTEIRDITG